MPYSTKGRQAGVGKSVQSTKPQNDRIPHALAAQRASLERPLQEK